MVRGSARSFDGALLAICAVVRVVLGVVVVARLFFTGKGFCTPCVRFFGVVVFCGVFAGRLFLCRCLKVAPSSVEVAVDPSEVGLESHTRDDVGGLRALVQVGCGAGVAPNFGRGDVAVVPACPPQEGSAVEGCVDFFCVGFDENVFCAIVDFGVRVASALLGCEGCTEDDFANGKVHAIVHGGEVGGAVARRLHEIERHALRQNDSCVSTHGLACLQQLFLVFFARAWGVCRAHCGQRVFFQEETPLFLRRATEGDGPVKKVRQPSAVGIVVVPASRGEDPKLFIRHGLAVGLRGGLQQELCFSIEAESPWVSRRDALEVDESFGRFPHDFSDGVSEEDSVEHFFNGSVPVDTEKVFFESFCGLDFFRRVSAGQDIPLGGDDGADALSEGGFDLIVGEDELVETGVSRGFAAQQGVLDGCGSIVRKEGGGEVVAVAAAGDFL